MTHQPAGGQCRTCAHMLRNCTHLPFHTMQPIKRDGRDIIEALSKQNPIASSDNCDLECGAYSTYCKCKAEAQQ